MEPGAPTAEAEPGRTLALLVVGHSAPLLATEAAPASLTSARRPEGLCIGSTGSVAIVTERADGATVVPTSAVTVGANRSTVRVLDGSDVETVAVEVGVVGDTWTQILDGVTEGQQVVLADVDQPLPSSATDSSNGTQRVGGFGPPGGFPGAGRFPGR